MGKLKLLIKLIQQLSHRKYHRAKSLLNYIIASNPTSATELDDDEMYSRPGVFPGARQALVISNKVIDDGNFRSSVSSRKDQMLLSEITAKLVSRHASVDDIVSSQVENDCKT